MYMYIYTRICIYLTHEAAAVLYICIYLTYIYVYIYLYTYIQICVRLPAVTPLWGGYD